MAGVCNWLADYGYCMGSIIDVESRCHEQSN